jgi:hypothetical protein
MNDAKKPSRIAGVPATPTFTANEREAGILNEIINNISSMRGEFWKQLMDPRRDVYAECGYPRPGNVTADMFQQMYDNEAIPARVVEVMSKECWQVTPTVYDEEGDEVTPFEEAWDNLGKQLRGEQSFYKDEEGSPVWDYLQRLDIMSGIGQYGVLLIGFDDGLDLSEPVKGVDEEGSQPVDADRPSEEYPPEGKGTDTTGGKKQADGYTPAYPSYSGRPGKPTANAVPLTCNGLPVSYRRQKYRLTSSLVWNAKDDPNTPGAPKPPGGKKGTPETGKKILYLRVFPESLAQITQWETNLDSPRYGQPVVYQMTFSDPRTVTSSIGPPNAVRNVHWTRCVHVPSDGAPTSNEVLGRPRQAQVLHNLLNLQKMYGANGEGYWKQAFGTLVLKTQAAAGVNPRINRPQLRNMVEALQMGLQRELLLQGMDAEQLAPELSDITPHKDAQLEAICIKLGVPVRVFKGSERGELASSQDDASWNDRLRNRQRSFVTPRIIVPFVDRLILCGVLPKPVGGTKTPAKPSLIAPGLPADAKPPVPGAKTTEDAPDPSKFGTDGVAPDDAEGVPPKTAAPVGNAFPPKPAGKPTTPPTAPPSSQESGTGDEPKSIEDMVNEDSPSAQVGGDVPEEEQEDPGYCVEWPDLDSQTKAEQATIAQSMTTALAAYVGGGLDALISPKDYLVRVCHFDEDEVDAILANTEMVAQKKAEDQAAQAEQQMAQQQDMIDKGLMPDPTDPRQQVPGQPPPAAPVVGMPAPDRPPAGPPKPNPFGPKAPVGNELAGGVVVHEYVLVDGEWVENKQDATGHVHKDGGPGGGQFTSGGSGTGSSGGANDPHLESLANSPGKALHSGVTLRKDQNGNRFVVKDRAGKGSALAVEAQATALARHVPGITVPTVRHVKLNGTDHGVTDHVDATDLTRMSHEDRAEALQKIPAEQIRKHAMFDYLLGSSDTNNGNYMVHNKTGDLVAIDKEKSLSAGHGDARKFHHPFLLKDVAPGGDATKYNLGKDEAMKMAQAGQQMADDLVARGKKSDAVGVRRRAQTLAEFAHGTDHTVGELERLSHEHDKVDPPRSGLKKLADKIIGR